MNPKLRNALVALGVLVIGGTVYEVAKPKPGTGAAYLSDAGLFDFPQARLRCPVRNLCPSRGARYGTWETCARDLRSVDAGLVLQWPTQPDGGDCIEVLGPCEFTDDGGVGDDGFCAGDGGQGSRFPSAITADLCACAPDDGCLVRLDDGGTGPAPRGVTLAPNTWSGSCARKACIEVAGEQGQSWPQECPP